MSRVGLFSGSRTRVISHRGVSAHFPENTDAAFEAAVDVGADAIEADLQLTADQQFIICHNPTLETFGYGDVSICQTPLADLQSYTIGREADDRQPRVRLASLQELLAGYAQRIPLLLEVKLHDGVVSSCVMDHLLEDLQPHADSEQIFVLCFDLEFLRQLQRRAPWLRVIWNTRSAKFIASVCRDAGGWLYGVDCRIAELTGDAVRCIRRHGCVSLSFTCNSSEEVAKAKRLGVDAIISDDPELARKLLSTESVSVANRYA